MTTNEVIILMMMMMVPRLKKKTEEVTGHTEDLNDRCETLRLFISF